MKDYEKFDERKAKCELSEVDVDVQIDPSDGSIGTRKSSNTKQKLLLILLLFLAASMTIYLCVKNLRHDETGDVIEFQFKGTNNIMRTITSSVKGGYVLHFTETTSSDKYWILDDFTKDLQVIRSDKASLSVCYVSVLIRTESMAPSADAFRKTANKKIFHGIYSPALQPIEDRSFLGPEALKLCADIELYWLSVTEDVLEVSNITGIMANAKSDEGRPRDQRDLRSCEESCCWMVCCCNTHHFSWEHSEYFSCKHICEHCSSVYKKKVTHVCSSLP
jgi:hypothetical protein